MKKLGKVSNIRLRVKRNNPFLIFLITIIIVGCKEKQTDETIKNIESDNLKTESIYSDLYEQIDVVFSFEEAQLKAQESNKPFLTFFNSLACVNCREFEQRVFFAPELNSLLSETFVIAILFVDDTKLLNKAEKLYSEITQQEIKTIGQYNSELQVLLTQTGDQPKVNAFDCTSNFLGSYNGKIDSIEAFKEWIIEIRKTIDD
ncbi:MAG: hypothetical protein Aureis2KO_32030 [Aureisphaera sp.]